MHGIGESRYADQGQGAGFGGHDRQADHYPGGVFGADEVVLNRTLGAAEQGSEDSNSHKVQQQDAIVDCRESHAENLASLRNELQPSVTGEIENREVPDPTFLSTRADVSIRAFA